MALGKCYSGMGNGPVFGFFGKPFMLNEMYDFKMKKYFIIVTFTNNNIYKIQ